jgi:putative CocE/NonD family hydrolase
MLTLHARAYLIGLATCIAAAFHGSASADNPDYNQGVIVAQQQMIPLPDGVRLAARVVRPLDQTKPLPVVAIITPYNADGVHEAGVTYVHAGYVFAAVDVRGRGDSEGVFSPLKDAGPDGAQAVEWLAKQPWCDGRVVLIGGSYVGMVQWQILAQHPKHLAAIIPTASVYPGYDVPNWKGVMTSEIIQWLALVSGHSVNFDLYSDGDYWGTQLAHMYKTGAPFSSLAPLTSSNQPVVEEWLQHHGYDTYWAAYNPDPKAYSSVDIPILAVTGYFDGDQPGEMRYYRELSQNASDAEKSRLYLLIGPWDHNGTHHPRKEVGGLTIPDNALLNIEQLRISWLDWVLKGGKRPEMLSDRVNYYSLGDGAGEWHHTSSLDGVSDHVLKFYLSSVDGPADDVFHSGRLITTQPADTDADTFRSDPSALNGMYAVDGSDANVLTDPRQAFKKPRLIYQSAPLTTSITIAGFMRLTSNISLDTPDADIAAEVDAVLPDGRTQVLGTDYVRARYRYGTSREALVTPGKIEPYVFDGFYLTGRQLPAGTRIRVLLAPLDTPDLEKNDNTGGPLGVNPTNHGRVTTISVHLDAAHPSYLELPLAKD